MSKDVRELQPHEVESRLRKMLRESNTELTPSELADRAERASNSVNEDFDPGVFDEMIEDAKKEAKIYEVLGKDFRSDYLKVTRMIEGLEFISNKFKENNLRDLTEVQEITKVQWLSQVKVNSDPLDIKIAGLEVNRDYAFASGVFMVLDIYVVPLKVLGLPELKFSDRSDRNVLNQMRKISYTIEDHPERLGLPKEADLGTMKVLSKSVLAFAVRDVDHPFTKNIRSFKNWKFITPQGYSI